jgi:hypothetical protein
MLIVAIIVSSILWILVGGIIFILITDYLDNCEMPSLGGLLFISFLGFAAAAGVRGIYDEAYKRGVQDHYLGKVEVKIKEVRQPDKRVIEIPSGVIE